MRAQTNVAVAVCSVARRISTQIPAAFPPCLSPPLPSAFSLCVFFIPLEFWFLWSHVSHVPCISQQHCSALSLPPPLCHCLCLCLFVTRKSIKNLKTALAWHSIAMWPMGSLIRLQQTAKFIFNAPLARVLIARSTLKRQAIYNLSMNKSIYSRAYCRAYSSAYSRVFSSALSASVSWEMLKLINWSQNNEGCLTKKKKEKEKNAKGKPSEMA